VLTENLTSPAAGSATFAWGVPTGGNISTGNGTSAATVSAGGTYTLTVTNTGNFCTKTTTATVAVDTAHPVLTTITPLPAKLTCAANAQSAVLTENLTSPAAGSATFAWGVPTGGNISTGNGTSAATVSAPGTYTLTVTNTVNSCTKTTAAAVSIDTAHPAPPTIPAVTLSCANPSVTLAGGTAVANMAYSWSGPSPTAITSGGTSLSPVVTVAGGYTLTVTDNLNTCTKTTTATVNPSAGAPAKVTFPVGVLTCAAPTATLSTTAVAGLTYSWAGPSPASIVSGGNTSTAVVNAVGTYSLTAHDPVTGCSTLDTVSVSKVNPFTLAMAQTPANCSNIAGTATVSIASGVANAPVYAWSANAAGQTTATINNIASGKYVVTVSASGCNVLDSIQVTQVPLAFGATVTTHPVSCALFHGAATVVTSGTIVTPSYTWSSGAPGTLTTPTDTGLVAGTYTVTVTDLSTSCVTTATATVISNVPAIATAAPSATINIGESISIGATTNPLGINNSYRWSNLDSTAVIKVTPLATTMYCVTVTDVNSCSASACAIIDVKVPCHEYYLPTAFSPNFDGENDVLYLRADPTCVASLKLDIFDRWGETVAQITNVQQGWDGSFRGKRLDEAVFVYFLTISFNDGTNVSKTGNVTLVR